MISDPASARAAQGCDCDRVDPTRYRLVVEGELGPRYSKAFEGMRVESGAGTTSIVGTVEDQAHLQGLLERVARLGLKLVSVTPENDSQRLPA